MKSGAPVDIFRGTPEDSSDIALRAGIDAVISYVSFPFYVIEKLHRCGLPGTREQYHLDQGPVAPASRSHLVTIQDAATILSGRGQTKLKSPFVFDAKGRS